MTPRPPRLGLRSRYLAATAGSSAAALAIGAALLYAHSTNALSDRALTIGLLMTFAAAGAGALALVAALADGFSRPLRAVVASLQMSASGNYEAAAEVASAGELRELEDAVNAMRISLRSSTISRDYLDRLLSGMGEALLIADAAGRIERVNAAASELFGLSETELVGKFANELIVSDDRRRADGAASRPREGSVPRPDGTAVSISYTIANVHDDSGKIESTVFVAHNIDERKRVEQRIRYLARTDPLTKIANRMQFQHLLQQMLELHPVRDLGQRIGAREVADPLLDALALVDVVRDEDRALDLAAVVVHVRDRVGDTDRGAVGPGHRALARPRRGAVGAPTVVRDDELVGELAHELRFAEAEQLARGRVHAFDPACRVRDQQRFAHSGQKAIEVIARDRARAEADPHRVHGVLELAELARGSDFRRGLVVTARGLLQRRDDRAQRPREAVGERGDQRERAGARGGERHEQADREGAIGQRVRRVRVEQRGADCERGGRRPGRRREVAAPES